MKLSTLARDYFGGLAHVHTVLSNHKGHRESNLTVDRIVAGLSRGGLIGEGAPLKYVMLNEHPSDPALPRLLGRLSLRGRRLLKQRRRPIVGRVPILYGLEVSILPYGRTDLTPRLADKCACVVASRHWLPDAIEHDPAVITELFALACHNPAVDVLGHPPRYIEDLATLDWAPIFATAAKTGTAIEVNLNVFPSPDSTDLQRRFWREWLRLLAESGARVFIGVDLHNQLQLDLFVAQWHGLDEDVSRDDNQLARLVGGLRRAGIRPSKVITANYERLVEWLALDKAKRAKLH